MSRYNSRRIATNRNEQWEKTLEDRGVKEVKQYTTSFGKHAVSPSPPPSNKLTKVYTGLAVLARSHSFPNK